MSEITGRREVLEGLLRDADRFEAEERAIHAAAATLLGVFMGFLLYASGLTISFLYGVSLLGVSSVAAVGAYFFWLWVYLRRLAE